MKFVLVHNSIQTGAVVSCSMVIRTPIQMYFCSVYLNAYVFILAT